MISAIKISQISVVSPDLSEKAKSSTVLSQEARVKAQAESTNITDTVSLGTVSNSAGTYNRQAIRNAADQRYESMLTLVKQFVNRQGEATKQASDATDGIAQSSAGTQSGISESGDWGIDAVSDRILQFALAVSGGDKTKYEALKNAIDKGFQQVAKSLGGELYGVSQETYKEVIRKLDAWKDDETRSRDMFIERRIG